MAWEKVEATSEEDLENAEPAQEFEFIRPEEGLVVHVPTNSAFRLKNGQLVCEPGPFGSDTRFDGFNWGEVYAEADKLLNDKSIALPPGLQ